MDFNIDIHFRLRIQAKVSFNLPAKLDDFFKIYFSVQNVHSVFVTVVAVLNAGLNERAGYLVQQTTASRGLWHVDQPPGVLITPCTMLQFENGRLVSVSASDPARVENSVSIILFTFHLPVSPNSSTGAHTSAPFRLHPSSFLMNGLFRCIVLNRF